MGSPQHYSTLLNNLAKAGRLSCSGTGVAWRTVATTPMKRAVVAPKALTHDAVVSWGATAHTVAPGETFVFNHAEAMKSATNKHAVRWWADLIHKC